MGLFTDGAGGVDTEDPGTSQLCFRFRGKPTHPTHQSHLLFALRHQYWVEMVSLKDERGSSAFHALFFECPVQLVPVIRSDRVLGPMLFLIPAGNICLDKR